MFAKWYEVNGIKCQGKVEKAVAEYLVQKNISFARGKAIVTPHGKYTPDFDLGDYYIEVKGVHSWLMACGVTSLFEKANKEEFIKKSDNSFKKMEWVNANIKPIKIYVQEENIDKKYLDDYFKSIVNIPFCIAKSTDISYAYELF